MRLNEIHDTYSNRVDFYCVYIQEMHPSDGWTTGWNRREGVLIAQPTNAEARAEVAQICALRLNFRMPMLVDAMSNDTDLKYAALPERLYLVDAAGRVAYRSGPGPGGFDVDGWEAAVREQALLS